jgi:hypothetical protein
MVMGFLKVGVYNRSFAAGVLCVIAGFHRGAFEICTIFRFYAAYNGSFIPTFRYNLSVPTSRYKQFFDR